MIELGQKVRDEITKIEGIAVAYTVYLNGCVRYCVQPQIDKEGKFREEIWIDEQQLKIMGKGFAHIAVHAANKTGGPGYTPSKLSTPPK